MAAIDNPVNDEFTSSNYNSIGNGTDGNWGDSVSDWVTKGVPLAVSSGVAQMWNSIGWAGNKIANIGSDDPTPFTDNLDSTWLVNNFDDANSYKTYYNQHQEGIDLGGFVLGSIVPSGLAVKGLTALQKGLAVSRAASATTGLLTNSAERFWLNKAALQMAAGEGVTGSRIGAAGSKFVQTTLEGLAAETATYATMSQAPMYKDVNSVGDFVGNAVTGAASFGAIGGLWRLGTFKRAKFDLIGAIGTDTNGAVTTNLAEVEKQVGKVLQDASFTQHSSEMAGLKVKLDKKGNVLNTVQSNLKANLDSTLGAAVDKYVYTLGDDITNTIAAKQKITSSIKNIEDVTKSRGVFTDALAARQRQVLSATNDANDTYMNKLFKGLSDDSNLAKPLKDLTTKLVSENKLSNVRQIFSAAEKVTRATEATNESLVHQIIDLSDGSIHNQAVNTLGDFGKVEFVNADLVKVAGKAVDLGKVTKSIENFRQATPANAQAKYFSEFKSLEKNVNSAIGDKVDSWNLPKLEAYFRKHNGFTLEETVGAPATYRVKNTGLASDMIATLQTVGTFRETSPEDLFRLLNAARLGREGHAFIATSKDLALGQGTNKGINVVFKPNGVYAIANETKLAMQGPLATYGEELIAKNYVAGAIDSVTIPVDMYKYLPRLAKEELAVAFSMKQEGDLLVFKSTMDLAATTSAITYTGDEALQRLAKLKLAEKDKLFALNPDITYPEVKTRLNVTDDFFGKRNIPAEAIINGIDTEALRHVAVKYAVEAKVPNYFEVRSAAFNQAKHDIYQDFQNEISNRILGQDNRFVNFDLADYEGIDRFAGTVTSANAEYNTVASKITHNGLQTQTTLMKWADARARKFLGVNNRILAAGDGSAVTTELASIKSLVTSTKDKVLINDKGELKLLAQIADESSAPVAAIKNQEVLDFMKVYAAHDAERVTQKNLGLQGIGKKIIDRYDDGTWKELYFAPPHPDDFLHKVLVSDSKGSVGMLWANTEKELNHKVALVSQANPEYIVRTPKDVDSYYQLLGDYEDALTLRGRTKIDSNLERQGILSDLAPTTNAKDLTDGIMNDFARSERTTMNNALMLKYGQQLAEAHQMGTALGNDTIGVKKIFNTLFNFHDQDTTWHKFNNLIEKTSDWTGGKLIASVKDNWSDIFSGKKSIDQVTANSIANDYGTNLFASDALWNLSKSNTYKGTTQNTLRNTNAVMRSLVLGIDYFNGLVNIIGTPILALPEVRAAFNSGESIPYMKLMGNAMKDMFGAGRRSDLEKYAKLGILNENMFVYHDLLDQHAIMLGAPNEAAALSASKKVMNTADKYFTKLQTPTAFAEQSTQLFSARLADQIGTARGLTGEDLDAFITTFTKKVVGNYTSAQRPLIFQGILGQAVGLFQTYNFNLFQQATRHIANGNDKSVALMAALQGSIFGAQSLPGFNLANQGLAAWGGDEHKDAYSETRRVLGNEVSDNLLYGAASNLLGANLWTRGDTNPRNITGIPITPSDLAQVSYYGKAFSALKQWGDSIMAGGNLKVSTLEAIAHANLSRPLTGLSELALGGRTTTGGTLETAVGQDLLSWSSAVRLLGAKPMQEALTSEATYKFGIIRAKEQKDMNDLAYAMRTDMIAGKGAVNQDAISAYAKKYVDIGGHPQGFRKWYLSNLAKATTPRAQLFAEAIKKNPWAKTYQELAQPDLSDGLEESMQTPIEARQQDGQQQ